MEQKRNTTTDVDFIKEETDLSADIFVTEKPSVAQQFRSALRVKGNGEKKDGYIEGYSEILKKDVVITWAIGHLVTLSYPEVYDENLKKWDIKALPFLPDEYRYEIIKKVAKQFGIVKNVFKNYGGTIYNCGDSGREGEYIQRLIYSMAGVEGKRKIMRVWIDSQTDSEILRGIKGAKPESAYDTLSDAAYMRAIEDYAMGINFSRALSCKFGRKFNSEIKSQKYKPISVGRVMTCVLGMVVERERQIRDFTETTFYKLNADCGPFNATWKAVEGSRWHESPLLYNETGFKEIKDAQGLLDELKANPKLRIAELERKDEKKQAPLLFNLAELQSECSRIHKISPDDTLAIAQKLYEAKLTTYPRTDARVLTTAVAAEIDKNLKGIKSGNYHNDIAEDILSSGKYKGISKTKYTDDSKVTDHYAIIPTGEGNVSGLSDLELSVYHMIIDRFLSIFMPPAVYAKSSIVLIHENKEKFFASTSKLKEPGYLNAVGIPEEKDDKEEIPDKMNIGDTIRVEFSIKEGKTQPPKRYTSGSMILAMENAGNLIEEEELREQIKGSGIGTSATRAATIKKLVDIGYLELNKKTQIIRPHPDGEAVYDIVKDVLPDFLSPKMTANWEKGLSQIESGKITKKDYETKLNHYIRTRIEEIKALNNGEDYEGAAFEKRVIGKCPLCGSDVTNTRKGNYICSKYKKDDPGACSFGVPRVFMKKTLTDEQMDIIFNGGKTGAIDGFKSKEGKNFSAILYYDKEEKRIKLEFPSKEDDEGLGKCPNCGGKVISGKFGAYCVDKCGMSVGRAMGVQLNDSQVKNLLLNKPIVLKNLKSKKDPSKKYDAKLTPVGIEDYSYTNKKGEEVKGKQFKFEMGFPENKKKKQ